MQFVMRFELDTPMADFNDPNAVQQQYATDESLRIRQEIHDKFTVPKTNYVEWVINTMSWRGDESVLDVGCGAGTYYLPLMQSWGELQYFGLDFSAGMLLKHPGTNKVIQAQANHLPYPDNSFDVVMANHMIYHLQDIDAALVEFRRVLKPGGVLMAATNSVQTMPELQVLMRRAILLLSRGGSSHISTPQPTSHLFALENGTRQLARHFYAVVRHDLPSKLVFQEVEPIMRYLESMRDMREAQLPDDVVWDDVMMIMRQQITHLVNHLGEMAVNKLSGVLIASDDGGFIQDFIHYRTNNTTS